MFSAANKSVSSGGYQVSNSLRFRASASAYLNKTQVTPTNPRVFTYSFWVKPSLMASQTATYLFEGYVNDTNRDRIGFPSNNLAFTLYQSGVIVADLVTTQVFRDPSAWYHFVIAYDSTQSTASARIKMYVNGAQITSFSTATYPPQNQTTSLNAASTGVIGRSIYSGGSITTTYFDGYMAEVNFIDGQALTPSSFGSINATTGVWQPARYTGSYGTNGFYLKFNNGTSTTTLGNDSSGNGNNWTTNNISLTAGSTYDWMIDSPTSYAGSSYGVGNYAVLNPLAARSSAVISSANLAVTTTGGNVYSPAPSSIAVSSGKWYFEALLGGSGTVSNSVGIALSTLPMSTNSPNSLVNATGTYAYINPGWSSANGTINTSYGAAWTFGDVIGVALDLTAGTLTYYKNGVSQGVATTGLSGSYVMFVEPYASTNFNINFGQRPFQFSPPSGFKSLNTYNLP